MNDTPETNKLLSDLLSELGTLGRHNCPELLVVHARKLERERDEAHSILEQVTDRLEQATIELIKLQSQRDEAREALVSERALADRLAENLKIACHAWNNPTEHPAITDWRQSRHE